MNLIHSLAMTDADPEIVGDKLSFVELVRIAERLVLLLYLPVIGWMLMMILNHEAFKNRVEANEFTAIDGYELTLMVNEGMSALRLSVQSLRDQADALDKRIENLEEIR